MDWQSFPPTFQGMVPEDPQEPNREKSVDRERCAKGVARFALMAMLVLFARTVVWVLDGLLAQPAELRVLSITIFALAGATLWQILEFRQYARRAFILVAAFTWSWALIDLIRNYRVSAPPLYGQLQSAEYLLFVAWTAVSVLFVAYLFQPTVRSLFTKKGPNGYQRLVALILLGHGAFFGMQYEGPPPQELMKVALKTQGAPQTPIRFQRECLSQESGRLPASVLSKEGMLSRYCECDSRVLARHCAPSVKDRRSCVKTLSSGLLRESDGAVNLIRDQEACVAEHFPNDAKAIFADRRRRVERQLVGQLSVSLPLAELVDGEESQSRLVHCLTVSLLSRCEDPRVSETLKCLGQTDYVANVERLQKRCMSLAVSSQGEYEKLLGEARQDKDPTKLEELVRAAPERPEGYLLRGERLLSQGKTKPAIEDFTIVAEVSQFPFTRMRTLRLRRRAYLASEQTALALQDAREGCELGAADLCREAAMELPPMQLSLGGEEAVRLLATAVLKDYPEAGVAARKMLPTRRVVTKETTANQAWESQIQMVEIALGTGDWKRAQELLPKALGTLKDEKKKEALGAMYRAKISKARGQSRSAAAELEGAITGWLDLDSSERIGLVQFALELANSDLKSARREALLLKLWKQAASTDSLQVRPLNESLARFYGNDRKKKMIPLLKRELEIYQERFGAEDPRTEVARASLVSAKAQPQTAAVGASGLDLSRKPSPPAPLK